MSKDKKIITAVSKEVYYHIIEHNGCYDTLINATIGTSINKMRKDLLGLRNTSETAVTIKRDFPDFYIRYAKHLGFTIGDLIELGAIQKLNFK